MGRLPISGRVDHKEGVMASTGMDIPERGACPPLQTSVARAFPDPAAVRVDGRALG